MFLILFVFIAAVCFAPVIVIALTHCMTIALTNGRMYDDWLRHLGAAIPAPPYPYRARFSARPVSAIMRGEVNPMKQILIVEDDPALGRGLALALDSADRVCQLASDCAAARHALAGSSFDLAIFDVNLPDGSGLMLLEETRAAGGPPVLLLTANDLETDIVTGLSLGADDYIVKPFSLAVLRARVEAALRRNTPAAAPAIFEQNGFHFDFDRLVFFAEGRPLQLSQTEQRLLHLLIQNRGCTLPRETLLDRIWTDGAEFVDENALSVAVGRLRRKLGKNAPIKTVYGVGYSWVVNV